MKAPKRKRALIREIIARSEYNRRKAELIDLAKTAKYVGSPEHKDTPSFAGHPKPRADASICPRELAKKQSQITVWLQTSIKKGAVSGMTDGHYPRYVWFKDKDTVYQGRLVNKGTGHYKGWPLNRDEWPLEINTIF